VSVLVYDLLWIGLLILLLVPKYIFWVDEYPKTPSGKIQKFKLKDMGIQLLREGKGTE
jgi:acyl-coenzyme A synthetase/AMP-(fatty) acid ligase